MENEKKPDKREIKDDNTLTANSEFGFLYKKCQKIRPYVLSMIALVPEYMEALKSYDGELNDETIYEIVRDEYLKMYNAHNSKRVARNIVNKISKDVKGDSLAWFK